MGLLLAAVAVMYLPTFYAMSQTTWLKDENGHAPMILALSYWLLWRERQDIFSGKSEPATASAFVVLVLGVAMYVLGRSQAIDTLEMGSHILVLGGSLLLLRGWAGVRKAWFPLFFLIFMIPLPGVVVQALTLPLKAAVSYCTEVILYAAGYPIGRSGVTLAVGPYQLLVADACSGLNSLFTLESLGLFYMKLMNYQSRARNSILATLIIPISFVSNVVRVMILVLVTYYFGDAAGQGFLHGFAGVVLFSVALLLTYALDRLLAARFDTSSPHAMKADQS
ncbi:MAG: exosortase B [Burkholderiales bacterium]|nr:exosortase B [Burkholderiales bacterium]